MPNPQLQIALDAKAAEMAKAGEYAKGRTLDLASALQGKTGGPYTGGWGSNAFNRLPASQWGTADDSNAVNPVMAYGGGSQYPPVRSEDIDALKAINAGTTPADPWSGMRSPGEAPVASPGYSATPTAPAAPAANPTGLGALFPEGSPIRGLITGGIPGMFAATPIGRFFAGLTPPGGAHPTGGLAALPSSTAGSGFLQAMGQNTSGMGAGQASNAFRDALASNSRTNGSGPGSQ